MCMGIFNWYSYFPWIIKLQIIWVFSCSLVAKSYPTLFFFFLIAHATPCAIAHQAPLSMIFQTKILDWVATFFSRVSSWLRDRTWVFWTGRRILYHWATGKAQYDYLCVCVCVCVCVCACAHTHNKSLQLCPTLCDPVDRSPTDSFIQGIFQNTGVGCYGLLQGIFPTQGLNMCLLYLLHWEAGCLPLAPLRKPSMTMKTDKSEKI